MTKQITKEGAGVVTQEFHISVTPVRDSEYWVRTEQVAPGVPLADEQFIWPVHDWLEQAQHLMNDPLVGLLQGNSTSRAGFASAGSPDANAGASAEPEAKSLVALGRLLYESLFQGRLRDSWMTAQGIAQHRGEVLRLRLGLKGSFLPRLPWEVLNGGIQHAYAGSARPLATGTDILFSRYQPGMGMLGAIAFPTAPKPRQTLRLLMAIAAPNDQQQLKLKQEAEHLQQELKQQAELLQNSAMIGTLPDIQVTILEQPGREQLAQALEQGNYQIFHFAGHSELSSAGGQIYLVNRQTGLSEPMSGDDLAGLLVNNGIQMAVFNSCRGAYTASMATNQEGAGDRSLTEALVSQGVPAVLAMAEQIPDDVALTLTRLFYRNLKQDYPVDL
ncbi:MAG: CHAT domain-containing protein, partial [Elainellaceae cyanobacterium]